MSTFVSQIVSIPIAAIVPHPQQPRRDFEQADIERLAASLRREELMQPIGVRPSSNSTYELIWGERRLRAARLNEWQSIPARVMNVNDRQSLTMLGSENLNRSEWNAIEKAEYLEALVNATGMSNSEVAKLFGHDKGWVRRLRQLLRLPERFREWVKNGELDPNTAVQAVYPFRENEQVMTAIQEDYETNRDEWGTRAACLNRAKFVASRFEGFDETAASDEQPITPDAGGAAGTGPPDSTAPPASKPFVPLSAFKEYMPLLEPFRRDVQILTTMRDLVQSLIDEAEQNAIDAA